jgi:AcrR family transcriptional regulator
MAPTKRSTKPKDSGAAGRSARSGGSSGAHSERRDALVQIAAELFAERGFKATTVRELGEAAGVLSGSLYHHFDSKETIVDEILSSYLDNLIESYRAILAKQSDPETTLSELIRSAFMSLGPHRAAITVLQNERNYLSQLPRFGYLATAEREIQHIWISVLEDGVSTGAFRKDLDPKIVYRFLRDSLWVAVRWFKPGGRMNAQELADQYLKLTLGGLSSHPQGLSAPAPARTATRRVARSA